jgi:hypothetical protein
MVIVYRPHQVFTDRAGIFVAWIAAGQRGHAAGAGDSDQRIVETFG